MNIKCRINSSQLRNFVSALIQEKGKKLTSPHINNDSYCILHFDERGYDWAEIGSLVDTGGFGIKYENVSFEKMLEHILWEDKTIKTDSDRAAGGGGAT